MKTTLLILAAVLTASALQAQTATPTPTPPVVDYIAQLRAGAPAPTPDPAVIVARTVVLVPQETSQLFATIAAFAHALWSDPTKAQALIDTLGAKAAPLFVSYGLLIGELATIDPPSFARLPKVPAGYGWTILPPQADGTWTPGQRSVVINYTAPVVTPPPTP